MSRVKFKGKGGGGKGGGGVKPPKAPTKLSNFRQTPPPLALEKVVFSPLLGQNFRKFVNFPPLKTCIVTSLTVRVVRMVCM